jgi:His/Glu/Gln/Arg/opine family amino acid ABC transporter permease subunit
VTFDWKILFKYLPILLSATQLTILLLIVPTLIGTAIGFILAFLKRSSIPYLRKIVTFYTWVLRSVPPLIVLFVCYFGLGQYGLKFSSLQAAIIGLSLIASAYYTEIIRSGIEAVNIGQTEAAKSLGLSSTRIIRRIILPQAIPIIIPPYLSNIIQNLKDTSLASAIAVAELVGMAKRVVASTMHPIEIYTVVAVIYVVLGSVLAHFQTLAEKKTRIIK